jgi:hypothetical protein
MVQCRYRVMPMMVLLSHAGDGVADVTLAMARCRCRGDLALA